jgi:type I restriction enzyme S subunit
VSVLDELATPRVERLGALARRVQEVDYPELEPLSVYLDRGVVRRADHSDNHNVLGADLAKYQRVLPGDLVFNRLRTWQGGFGASNHEGIVSPAYVVLRPDVADARYLDYVLHSAPYLAELTRLSKWMPPSQFDILWADLKTVPVPKADVEKQRRIADFLDDRVAQIDRIIAARRQQVELVEAAFLRASLDTVRGIDVRGQRRDSGLEWLGDIPDSWPMLTVNMEFSVDLGKMLDEKAQSGMHPLPYLRNTNVQWDRVVVDDLKVMDIAVVERERFTVRQGDLLICEGGQPGRAAMWDGRIQPVGYQKALHRARSRGRSRPEWLLECLRSAVTLDAFAAENGQTTIGHLTNEQLRSQRFPFPDPPVQATQLQKMADYRAQRDSGSRALTRSIDLLTEYKTSLITAAVTGELDVTTAGSGIPR